MKKSLALISCLALAACSQTMGAQMEYINKVHHVAMPDDTYRIYDHPSGNKVMVSPSMGKIASAATVTSWTFGTVDALPATQAYINAAQQRMNQTGRSHCKPVSARPLMKPMIEVAFNCGDT